MDYQGNAKKGKTEKPAEEKKLEKVIAGEVVVNPPSVGKRFAHIFLGGDSRSASEYVVSQVLLPALRDMALKSVYGGLERLIYGDSSRPAPRQTTTTYSPRVQYNNPVARQGAGGTTYSPKAPWAITTPGRKTFDDMTFGMKEDAESVVEAMMNIVNQYEVVSVADLNELIGLPIATTDHKWGWTNLTSMTINQTKDGWTVTFPAVEEI